MEYHDIRVLSQLAQIKHCTSLVLTYRPIESHELARYTLHIGYDFKNILQRDLNFLLRSESKCRCILLRYCKIMISNLQQLLLTYDFNNPPITDESYVLNYKDIHSNIKYEIKEKCYYIEGFLNKIENSKSIIKFRRGNFLTKHFISTKFKMFKVNEILDMYLDDNVLYIETI